MGNLGFPDARTRSVIAAEQDSDGSTNRAKSGCGGEGARTRKAPVEKEAFSFQKSTLLGLPVAIR
jgi:hypothetical protein